MHKNTKLRYILLCCGCKQGESRFKKIELFAIASFVVSFYNCYIGCILTLQMHFLPKMNKEIIIINK